ncbi:hydroxyacid dehydrogenase [Nocardia sp. NBC_00403]|uniref:hydroxyacid dehydrogenase n=1 Tax=Nocardia sp. NBC_00403 TaxID=2975990 RepID=UPI002E23702A
MRVAIFEAEQWEHRACLRLEPDHQVHCSAQTLNVRNAADYADAEVLSPFVYSTLSAEVLAQFPMLQLIATRSTGFDHIDLEYCALHGITVCNVPDYGDATVAEHVFALLLGLARHIVDATERTRQGVFSHSDLRGFELSGKVLAVIGTGRIGLRVIQIARGFGMRIIASDRQPDAAAAQRLGFRYASLDETLAAADIVTLHVPATPETAHLMSDREFALMKPGAVLINTARGTVVSVPALLRALDSGRLRAAGLDVLPDEHAIREEAEIFRELGPEGYDMAALIADHILLRFPNVLVTPHIAYNTDEAVHRIVEHTVQNIEAYARHDARNVVRAPTQSRSASESPPAPENRCGTTIDGLRADRQ